MYILPSVFEIPWHGKRARHLSFGFGGLLFSIDAYSTHSTYIAQWMNDQLKSSTRPSRIIAKCREADEIGSKYAPSLLDPETTHLTHPASPAKRTTKIIPQFIPPGSRLSHGPATIIGHPSRQRRHACVQFVHGCFMIPVEATSAR